jgi:hypothetical protein
MRPTLLCTIEQRVWKFRKTGGMAKGRKCRIPQGGLPQNDLARSGYPQNYVFEAGIWLVTLQNS